jgi:hypothetical protein
VEIPSEASLREMPEIDFSRTPTRPNPYVARLALQKEIVVRAGDQELRLPVGRRRPSKAEATGSSTPRSVRLPDAVWKELERRAAERGLTAHAAMRQAIAAWLDDVA